MVLQLGLADLREFYSNHVDLKAAARLTYSRFPFLFFFSETEQY